jgi:hypothetical protein
LNGPNKGLSGESVVDPFDNFRSTRPTNLAITTVTLESGTYDQVPSRYSKIDPMVSIHSVKNKFGLGIVMDILMESSCRIGSVESMCIFSNPVRFQCVPSSRSKSHRVPARLGPGFQGNLHFSFQIHLHLHLCGNLCLQSIPATFFFAFSLST